MMYFSQLRVAELRDRERRGERVDWSDPAVQADVALAARQTAKEERERRCQLEEERYRGRLAYTQHVGSRRGGDGGSSSGRSSSCDEEAAAALVVGAVVGLGIGAVL
jgi:hypothetical protein